MTVTFNEKINSTGGGVVGILQGLALVFLIVYAAGLWPQPAMRQLFIQTSLVGRAVFRLCPRVISAIDQVEFGKTPSLALPDKREKPETP